VKRTLLAAIIIAATVLSAGPVDASQKKIEGDWTFTVEHLPLKLAYCTKTRLCPVLSDIGVFVRGSLPGCVRVWIHFRFLSSLLPVG